ncbi:MAG TPA: DUF5947 family protein [Natronosporangium sp.]|nr:DUF5947 family protein [Natronosporangium sp.]
MTTELRRSGRSPGATRLRRFIRPADPATEATGADPAGCELCGQPLPETHGHLVDLHQRGIACVCPACRLLFQPGSDSGLRYRSVPDRYRYRPQPKLTDGLWHRLGVPVGLAFCFYNSTLEQPVVVYPSPAGPTEAELSTHTWPDLVAAEPLLAQLQPDVEAVLVNRVADPAGARYETFLIPIDVGYQLVGLIRQYWRGFDGGQEAWQEIHRFLATLRERAEWVGEADA